MSAPEDDPWAAYSADDIPDYGANPDALAAPVGRVQASGKDPAGIGLDTRPAGSQKGQLNALYRVERDGRSYWLRIGTAFPVRSGRGLVLQIDAVPLNFTGKILLAPPFK